MQSQRRDTEQVRHYHCHYRRRRTNENPTGDAALLFDGEHARRLAINAALNERRLERRRFAVAAGGTATPLADEQQRPAPMSLHHQQLDLFAGDVEAECRAASVRAHVSLLAQTPVRRPAAASARVVQRSQHAAAVRCHAQRSHREIVVARVGDLRRRRPADERAGSEHGEGEPAAVGVGEVAVEGAPRAPAGEVQVTREELPHRASLAARAGPVGRRQVALDRHAMTQAGVKPRRVEVVRVGDVAADGAADSLPTNGKTSV